MACYGFLHSSESSAHWSSSSGNIPKDGSRYPGTALPGWNDVKNSVGLSEDR